MVDCILFLVTLFFLPNSSLYKKIYLRFSHPEMRSQRRIDDVHLKNGTHFRQGKILCFRTCFLRHCRHWSEGPHYGAQLQARQEGGLV